MSLRIFDGHCDIWPDVAQFGKELDYKVFETRHRKRFEKGAIAGGIFVMWQDPFYEGDKKEVLIQMVEAMEKELESNPHIYHVIKRGEDIQELADGGRFSIMIGLEGLCGLDGDLELVRRLYDKGLRHIGMTWNEANAFATGNQGDEDRGVTALGRELLKIMSDKKMLLDISHLNRKSSWDVMSHWDGPLIASHSNVHAICPVPRNLEDDLIKTIAQKDGIIGLNAYKAFVHEEEGNQSPMMLARHAAHIANLVGVEHLAFGLDFCEFLDVPDLSELTNMQDSIDRPELKTVVPTCAEVHSIISALEHEGFTKNDLEKIAFGNFRRILQKVGV